jgi:hypothetical protein
LERTYGGDKTYKFKKEETDYSIGREKDKVLRQMD